MHKQNLALKMPVGTGTIQMQAHKQVPPQRSKFEKMKSSNINKDTGPLKRFPSDPLKKWLQSQIFLSQSNLSWKHSWQLWERLMGSSLGTFLTSPCLLAITPPHRSTRPPSWSKSSAFSLIPLSETAQVCEAQMEIVLQLGPTSADCQTGMFLGPHSVYAGEH